MARYTSDVLKLTGVEGLPDPSPGSYNDTRGFWGTDINAWILLADAEFGLVYAGNPNTYVASTYIGKKIFDTVNKKLWIATNVADAASTVWVEVSPDKKHRKVTTSGNITINAITDEFVEVALNTPAAIDINLPTGLLSTERKMYYVLDGAGNASTYNLTVKSGALINGAASFVINRDYASFGFLWNGTTWRII